MSGDGVSISTQQLLHPTPGHEQTFRPRKARPNKTRDLTFCSFYRHFLHLVYCTLMLSTRGNCEDSVTMFQSVTNSDLIYCGMV